MANLNVKYITYKGVKYPILVSYYAISRFQDETCLSISELGSNLSNVEILLWYSLVAGHEAAGKELTLIREKIPFMLDECLVEFNSLASTFYPELTKDIEDSIDNEVSKKN